MNQNLNENSNQSKENKLQKVIVQMILGFLLCAVFAAIIYFGVQIKSDFMSSTDVLEAPLDQFAASNDGKGRTVYADFQKMLKEKRSVGELYSYIEENYRFLNQKSLDHCIIQAVEAVDKKNESYDELYPRKLNISGEIHEIGTYVKKDANGNRLYAQISLNEILQYNRYLKEFGHGAEIISENILDSTEKEKYKVYSMLKKEFKNTFQNEYISNENFVSRIFSEPEMFEKINDNNVKEYFNAYKKFGYRPTSFAYNQTDKVYDLVFGIDWQRPQKHASNELKEYIKLCESMFNYNTPQNHATKSHEEYKYIKLQKSEKRDPLDERLRAELTEMNCLTAISYISEIESFIKANPSFEKNDVLKKRLADIHESLLVSICLFRYYNDGTFDPTFQPMAFYKPDPTSQPYALKVENFTENLKKLRPLLVKISSGKKFEECIDIILKNPNDNSSLFTPLKMPGMEECINRNFPELDVYGKKSIEILKEKGFGSQGVNLIITGWKLKKDDVRKGKILFINEISMFKNNELEKVFFVNNENGNVEDVGSNFYSRQKMMEFCSGRICYSKGLVNEYRKSKTFDIKKGFILRLSSSACPKPIFYFHAYESSLVHDDIRIICTDKSGSLKIITDHFFEYFVTKEGNIFTSIYNPIIFNSSWLKNGMEPINKEIPNFKGQEMIEFVEYKGDGFLAKIILSGKYMSRKGDTYTFTDNILDINGKIYNFDGIGRLSNMSLYDSNFIMLSLNDGDTTKYVALKFEAQKFNLYELELVGDSYKRPMVELKNNEPYDVLTPM